MALASERTSTSARVPRPRRARAAACKATPVETEPFWEAGHALTLTEPVRLRLRGFVHALLREPGIAGTPAPARMGAVALTTRTNRATVMVKGLSNREFGRWLGLDASSITHTVREHLVGSDVAHSRPALREGTDVIVGSDWLLMPLWRVWRGENTAHPLWLNRSDLVVLKRLLEAICAPGWRHKDGSVTPAGLLAHRTGHGAAIDRLALLLAVLEARPTGAVRLRPGAVDEHGRAAATLAHLLDCSTEEAARVLQRLEAEGQLRTETTVSAKGTVREQVVVPAVAEAYRAMRRLQRAQGRAGARRTSVATGDGAVAAATQEGVQNQVVTGPVAPVEGPVEAEGIAGGDQIRLEDENVQASGGFPELEGSEVFARPHALHTPVVSQLTHLALSGSCSGEAASGTGRRPGCARGREDRLGTELGDVAGRKSPRAGRGPLRGEQHTKSRSRPSRRHPNARPGRPGTVLPADERLQTTLGPVAKLWARLTSTAQQRRLLGAVEVELTRIAGVVDTTPAPQLLALRLSERLRAQGGDEKVRDPLGWLLGRGLPQRSACGGRLCDDRVRLDTGEACPTCGQLTHQRRGRRRKLIAQIAAEMPQATAAQQHAVLTERLAAQVAAEDGRIRQQYLQREAERTAFLGRRAEAEAAQVAAADARRPLPCGGCGRPDSSGMCERCARSQAVEELLTGASVELAAAHAMVTPSTDEGAAVFEEDLRRQVTAACQKARTEGMGAHMVSLVALDAAKTVAAQARTRARTVLEQTAAAQEEGDRVRACALRRERHGAGGELVLAAAERTAQAARERVAAHLLRQLQKQIAAAKTASEPAGEEKSVTPVHAASGQGERVRLPWSQRLPLLAAGTTSDDLIAAGAA